MITLSVKEDYFIINFDKADEGVFDRMRKEDSILYKAFWHYNDSTLHESGRTVSSKYLSAIIYASNRYGVRITSDAWEEWKKRKQIVEECEQEYERYKARVKEDEKRIELEKKKSLWDRIKKRGCKGCSNLKLIGSKICCEHSGNILKGIVDMYKEYDSNFKYGMITEIKARPDEGCVYAYKEG